MKKFLLIGTTVVVGGFGLYVYAMIANVDRVAEKSLKLWDKTESVILYHPGGPGRLPATCLEAKSDAAKLKALENSDTLDKLGMLEERWNAARALAASGKRCTDSL